MLNKDYITEIYFFIDELLKNLKKSDLWDQLPKWIPYNKGRKRKLSLSEVITLNIIRVLNHFTDLKAFHRNASIFLIKDFPGLPNYENFLKATNKSFPYLIVILHLLLTISKINNTNNIKAIDSTPLPVCKNRRISRNKVCKGFAGRGKTTMGWFYGFKLHGISDLSGNILSITITPGNIDDRKVFNILFKNLSGIILGDAGYVISEKKISDFLKNNIHLFTSVRNNMKKIMTKTQHNMLKKREAIETVWSILKERLSIVTSLARSITGLMRHYYYVIVSYFFRHLTEKRLQLVNNF